MLSYRKSDAHKIVGYSDADWAGFKDTRRSMSGYIFTLAGGAISWRSLKQTIVASSTMYAEFIACYEATGQGIWLMKFVPGLRVVNSIERPLKIYCDNTSAVDYCHNNWSSGATKHIDIKFYVVKERIQDHTIDVEQLGTDQMLTDPLTKGLPPSMFSKHVAGMGLREGL